MKGLARPLSTSVCDGPSHTKRIAGAQGGAIEHVRSGLKQAIVPEAKPRKAFTSKSEHEEYKLRRAMRVHYANDFGLPRKETRVSPLIHRLARFVPTAVDVIKRHGSITKSTERMVLYEFWKEYRGTSLGCVASARYPLNEDPAKREFGNEADVFSSEPADVDAIEWHAAAVFEELRRLEVDLRTGACARSGATLE